MTLYVKCSAIRVSNKQNLSRDKVNRHRRSIQDDDVMPIDVHALGDGTYVIAGNGRHRLAAYVAEGFTSVPVRLI